jgi:hypothetical protein
MNYVSNIGFEMLLNFGRLMLMASGSHAQNLVAQCNSQGSMVGFVI